MVYYYNTAGKVRKSSSELKNIDDSKLKQYCDANKELTKERLKLMKHIANIITFLRIPLAIAMLFTAPFSMTFWGAYIGCGITDIFDGFIARILHQESAFGAKLDSIADFVFAVCAAVFVVANVIIPGWLWLCILGIAILRLLVYGIGLYKFHTFSSLHTYANKLTGALIFMTPIIYRLFGVTFTGIVLCITAFLSAIEELIITIKSKELNRDCISMFKK